MVEELHTKIGLRLRRLGYQQQPRCVLVDTVHQTDIRIIHINIRATLLKVVCQGVQECMFVIAVAGMNNQSGRFVHHQQIIIFIHYIQRYRFGLYSEVVRFMAEKHLYGLPWFDLIAATDDLAAHEDLLSISRLLDTAARCTGYMLGKVFIHSHRCLAFVDHTLKANEQLVLPVKSIGVHKTFDAYGIIGNLHRRVRS